MKQKPAKAEEDESPEMSRFRKFATAIFKVDKRDVPKHEPKKRVSTSHATSDK